VPGWIDPIDECQFKTSGWWVTDFEPSTRIKVAGVAPRLWKKFQKLLTLPEKDRRAVIRLLNSLATRKAE
jgi:hypothetical protein